MIIRNSNVERLVKAIKHLDQKEVLTPGANLPTLNYESYSLTVGTKLALAQNLSILEPIKTQIEAQHDALVHAHGGSESTPVPDESMDVYREDWFEILSASVEAPLVAVDAISLEGVPLSVLAWLWPLCAPLCPEDGFLGLGSTDPISDPHLKPLWRSLYSLEGQMIETQVVYKGEVTVIDLPHQYDIVHRAKCALADNISRIENGGDKVALWKVCQSYLNLEANNVPVSALAALSPILVTEEEC